MVGNVEEWVAEWGDLNSGCTDWTTATGLPGGDFSCFGGDGSPKVPGALFRGGNWFDGTNAGVFTVRAYIFPSVSGGSIGFRGAR
jgi:hypothetical protein